MAENISDSELLIQFRNPETKEAAFTAIIKKYQDRLAYHLNPDFNGRTPVGDNPDDFSQVGYGNNDVEGADAPPRYADLASRFGVPVTQVANYLHWARNRFRGHVLETLRSLTGSEAEFREEARALLGREP